MVRVAKLSISEQIAEQEKHDSERKQRFREAAKAFAGKLASRESVQELALCGFMVTQDPYPNDIDLAIVVDSLDELPVIARAARHVSSTYHGWEVFVFQTNRTYAGRICHRKQCPREPWRCENADCGNVPYLGNLETSASTPRSFWLRLSISFGPVDRRACFSNGRRRSEPG